MGLFLDQLMRDKLGPYFEWTPPILTNLVGPYQPEVWDRFDVERQKIKADCGAFIAELNDDEVLILRNNSLDDPDEITSQWHSLKKREIRLLNEACPPWFAGGLGHPEYVADFEHWAMAPHYTRHEALMLSVGVEPTHMGEETITKFIATMTEGKRLWPTLTFLIKRRDLIHRQFPRRPTADNIRVEDLFMWFEMVGLDLHPALYSKYVSAKPEKADNKANLHSKAPHKKEVDSVSQLFAAMVIEYYGYDPEATKSPIPREIANLAASLGMKISDDTIRKYLKQGASFISDDWKPK